MLEPGTYTLAARAFATLPFTTICFGFLCSGQIPVGGLTDSLAAVDFRLVPEPGTLSSTLAGLCLLAALSQRRRC